MFAVRLRAGVAQVGWVFRRTFTATLRELLGLSLLAELTFHVAACFPPIPPDRATDEDLSGGRQRGMDGAQARVKDFYEEPSRCRCGYFFPLSLKFRAT